MYSLIATYFYFTHCSTLHTYMHSMLIHTPHHCNFLLCLYSFGGLCNNWGKPEHVPHQQEARYSRHVYNKLWEKANGILIWLVRSSSIQTTTSWVYWRSIFGWYGCSVMENNELSLPTLHVWLQVWLVWSRLLCFSISAEICTLFHELMSNEWWIE